MQLVDLQKHFIVIKCTQAGYNDIRNSVSAGFHLLINQYEDGIHLIVLLHNKAKRYLLESQYYMEVLECN